MPQKILAEDWSEYDKIKRQYADPRYFNCTEEWEVDFIKNKIMAVYPLYSPAMLEAAIDRCTRHLPVPYIRTSFVTCLMIILKSASGSGHDQDGRSSI